MATVLQEYLVKFGFDVNTQGLDRMVSGLKASEGLFNSIRAPFDAFNNAMWALNTVTNLVVKPIQAFIAVSTEAALAADKLGEQASMLGIASKDLESFGFAAEQSGTNSEDMTFALKQLNREMANASNGSKESAAAFSKHGLKIHDSAGKLKSAGDMMQETTAYLAAIPDEAKRSAAAIDIFGKAGLGLKNFLSQTPEQLAEIQMEFAMFGGETSKKLIALGDAYDKSLKKQKLATDSFGRAFSTGLQPTINAFNKWIEDFLRRNGPAFRLFFLQVGEAVGKVADFVGGMADTFFNAFTFIADGVLSVLKAFEPLLPVIAAVGGAILVAFFPLVGVFLAIEDFMGFLQGKDSLFGDLLKNLGVDAEQIKGFILFLKGVFSASFKDWSDAAVLAIDYYKQKFVDFWNWLVAAASSTGAKVFGALTDKLKGLAGFFGINVSGGGESTASAPPSVGASVSSISNNQTSNARQTTNNVQAPITVNAAPGMDERKLAEHAAQSFKDMMNSEVRSSYPDVAYSR